MTPAERADAILQEMTEFFLVGGQLKLWLRNRIIEEIQKALKEKKDVKSKTNF